MNDIADLRKNIAKALDVAVRYGSTDGAHHKAWVIDQMVRALCGSKQGENTVAYLGLVEDAKNGEDGPDTYPWDEGIAP